MSRPLRIEYPGAWYHLMNRGRRGDNIFEVDEDRDMFITVLKEASSLWGVHISSFCLMDNHYHLLAQTPQGNLSRFMRHLNGVYTQRFNRLHGYDGQLFRGRYKSVIVGEDNHLLELVRYIHRNPLRAGMVDTLSTYKWSSHPGYLSNAKKWDWLNKGFVLSMLSIEKKKQKNAYLEFMGQGDSEQFENLFAKEKWPLILGDDSFVSWVKETFFTSKQNREIPDSRQLAPEVDHIVTTVSRVYEVQEQNLFVTRRGQKNEPRDVAIYLCRVLRNDTLKEIGTVFGLSGYGPAGNVVSRVERKMSQDKKLQCNIRDIINSLS